MPTHLEAESEDGKPVGNVSGLACTGALTTPRECLIVDDEMTFAQRAVIGNGEIKAGATIEIVNAGTAVGKAPELKCDEPKKPKDLDGEAVAEAGGAFYVIGSHGCGRSQGAFRSSSFLAARISPADKVDLSYRVSEVLRSCPVVGRRFGMRLEDIKAKDGEGDKPAVPARPGENGLNVEGLAVSGDRMWIGLRGPVENGTAFIVSVATDAVFRDGMSLDARLHRLRLGPDQGIRDLASLSDGRLLVLAGPRTNAGRDYSIWVYDPRDGAEPTSTRTFAPTEFSGKPEGILVLREAGGLAQILMVQDGPIDGDPQEIEVSVPGRVAAQSRSTFEACPGAGA